MENNKINVILKEYERKDVLEFQLQIADDYKKNLYIDVSKEYIKQLNIEIAKIIESIPENLKEG